MTANDRQSFPDTAGTALLLIDFINDLEFDGGEELLPRALRVAEHTAALKRRCADAGIPSVYLNDNFGQWRSDFRMVVARNRDGVRGSPVVRTVLPAETDYFVLKPKHSGFFDTTLQTLLRFLGVRRLILTGLTADMCVLFTAMDAYMRDYALAVPRDCVAAQDEQSTVAAVNYLDNVLKADTRSGAELDLGS